MATKTAAKKGAAKKGSAKAASSKKGASSRGMVAATASSKASSAVSSASFPAVRQEIRVAASSRTPFDKLVKDLAQKLTIKKPGVGGCSPCFSGLDRVIIENPEAMRKLR